MECPQVGRGGMFRQINSNWFQSSLRIALCIMHKLHYWRKEVFWQRFWLDFCTKQVVSARACKNQFLPCSSSGIAIFDMRTVQAESCLNSEQIDTLFISVGGQEGGLGEGGILNRNPKIYAWLSWWCFVSSCGGPEFTRACHKFFMKM